jgi:lysozyme family protein
MATTLTSALTAEYRTLFAGLTPRPDRLAEIGAILRRMTTSEAKLRYAAVEAAIGVPWFVVGIIHSLEAGQRFDRHLHNGDPLTARTRQVPAGRPKQGDPPFKWQDSAIDALRLRKLDQWTDWSAAGIAFTLEGYNGFGYRSHHPEVKTPYLWSYCNVYSSGKYVADGRFSSAAVSQQCGGMVLLAVLMREDAEVAARVGGVPAPVAAEAEEPAEIFPKVDGPEGFDSTSRAAGVAAPPPYPGRYLSNGLFDDADVRLVQLRLRDLGVPVGLDSDYGDRTEDAVRLFQARAAGPDGRPLDIDGIVGPGTWAALVAGPGASAPASAPVASAGGLAEAVLAVAAAEVGVREDPLGSNRGPRVDEYIRAAGLDPTQGSFAWCMCFVYWCFDQAARDAGIANPVPRSAGVKVAWARSQELPAPVRVVTAEAARRRLDLVQPGMAFFLDTGGGTGHCGLVVANLNGDLETIEGNTTDISGSREGIGVFRRNRRSVAQVNLGFVAYG